MRKLISQTEFQFKIVLQSPLLIASMDPASINVGGVDTIMAKNPVTNMPFIPPSSLYGKLRHLHHMIRKDTDKDPNYYFGSPGARDSAIINIKSIMLNPVSKEDVFAERSENTISRMTLSAKPRILNPAQEGLEFICTLLINLYDDHSEKPDKVIKNVILPILVAFEDDYIGGCGTRGLGSVEVYIKDSSQADGWQRPQSIKEEPLSFSVSNIAGNASDVVVTDEPKEEIVYMQTRFFSGNKIQSATLAGLFAYALANLNKDGLIEKIYKGEDFLISSAFPYITKEDNNKIHFFPRPLVYLKGIKTHKNKKDLLYSYEYVSKGVLKEFFNALSDPSKESQFIENLCDKINADYRIVNNLLMTKSEYESVKGLNLCSSSDLMHVCIDPETGFPKIENEKGILFSTHDYFFSDNFGFFFLVKHYFNDIMPILELIEKMGMGRDKSQGMGYFNFTKESSSLLKDLEADKGNRHYSLSLIHPSDSDKDNLAKKIGNNSYTVIARKGKRENNAFKGTGNFRAEKYKIFMLTEGSIFGFSIIGSAPVVYPKNEDGYEIKDYGFAYIIRF